MSVVILSHRKAMLPQAIRSVWRQEFPDDEIELIVKHGSVYHGHKLPQALMAAAGEFIVPLCDDDELAPTYLRKTIDACRESGADFAYTDVFLFGGPDGDRELTPLPPFNAYTVTQRAVPWMTATFRRTVFDRVQYDPTMQYLDIDLNRSMVRAGITGIKVPEYLFRAREHPDNGHKQMDHGWAHNLVRTKHLLLDPPVPPLAEFVYPDWEDGRPDIMLGV